MADYNSRYTGEEVDERLGLAETALQEQAQADWAQTDDTAPDYIKNKPTVPDEFIALYGVTTYAEITAALSDGKTVTMNRDGLIYGYCGEDIRHRYRFAALFGGLVGQGEPNVSAQLCLVSSTDEWTNTYVRILTRSDIVTSIDAQSTNTQVPGAKAVYDAIQAAGGGGGMHLITDDGYPFRSEQDLENYQGTVEDGDIAWVLPPTSDGNAIYSFYFYDATLGWTPLFELGAPVEAVMYDYAQSLNSTQKAQARTNIGAGTYSKPSGGIPDTDLASAVRTSLGKADSAVQPDTLNNLLSALATEFDEALEDVTDLIPAAATPQNQLADKAFVNSSVATNTANYISDNGQPFTSLAALQAYSGPLTNNDYAFVVGTDSDGNTTYTRYKYVASTDSWAEEYVLNNSSFTAAQWAAISSGITSADVEKIANAVLFVSQSLTSSQKSQARSNIGAGTYSKASTGIPKTDLASAVQTSLGKADTAYQKPSTGIPASDLASDVIPTVPTISTNIASDKTSDTKTASPKAVYNEVHPAPGTSEPSGGFLPNVVYNLGTITGSRSFAMAAAVTGIVNHYFWTFDTGSTAPTITWPAAITAWNGGSAPTINASKHYEISVLNGIGAYMEV